MESRIPKALRTGLAALALVAATVGLAYAAGGDLPDQASDKATAAQEAKGDAGAERKAGSTGPEDGGDSASSDVHEVIEDRDGGGCEFGQAVAEAARGDDANEDAGAEDPCDHEGNENSEQDEAKAAREAEREERKAARTQEANGGRETGEEHSSNAKSETSDDDSEETSDDDSEDESDDDDEPKEKDNNGVDGSEKSGEARSEDRGKGNDE